MSPRPGMSRWAVCVSANSVRLRPWQHAALARFISHDQPDFLAVATPGAGKTTFALVAARMVLAEQPAPVVVVTPTAHLKTQWAQAAARLQLHLDPAWSAADGGLPSDMHGVVITYQQVALNPAAVRRLAVGASSSSTRSTMGARIGPGGQRCRRLSAWPRVG
jgi:superfamily II DNA or RNA helicase